ncbi:MAG: hypothetical protein ACK452_06895 [Bacteroidota bacterium]
MSQLVLIKKGDFKSGIFSKLNAGDYHFYEDKIIFYTRGLSRLFNSAPITIEKSSILSFTEGFSIIGYTIKLNTKSGSYTMRLIGDKLEVYRILNSYTS